MKKVFFLVIVLVIVVVAAVVLVERGKAPPEIEAGINELRGFEDEIRKLKALAEESGGSIEIEKLELSAEAIRDGLEFDTTRKCTAVASISTDDGDSSISVTARNCEEAVQKVKAMLRPGKDAEPGN